MRQSFFGPPTHETQEHTTCAYPWYIRPHGIFLRKNCHLADGIHMKQKEKPAQIPMISLRGVSTHNLQHVDVDFPLGQITTVTGRSGSGKSSLVFDTLYAESYRRYVDSLSSYARQYMKALPRAPVKSIHNLPAAIALQQGRASGNRRSTVATLTELDTLLQNLYTHVSTPHCPKCDTALHQDHLPGIYAQVLEKFQGQPLLFLCSFTLWKEVPWRELKGFLQEQGYSRYWKSKGGVASIEEAKDRSFDDAWLILDRISVTATKEKRIVETIEKALRLGRGLFRVLDTTESFTEFSNRFWCSSCSIEVEKPKFAFFSFQHPLGACPTCQGFGREAVLDWQKIIPDHTASIHTKGIACLNFGSHDEYYADMRKSAKQMGIDTKKPFSAYTDKEWKWLKSGQDTGTGHEFSGIHGYFIWLDSKKYKPHYRIHSAKYRTYVTCPTCTGMRFHPETNRYRIAGCTLGALYHKPIEALHSWLEAVQLSQENTPTYEAISELFTEMQHRTQYLQKIGVGYLTLHRSARTLSGGELQRIHMARCLGSALTDTLFCLDEPTAGLHAKDSTNLLEVIRELQRQGNTIVMIEHDPTLIRGSDSLVEIGPQAGHLGGHVTYSGPTHAYPASETLTPLRHTPLAKRWITLKGARTHNLQDITVQIPLGKLTTVCGVSGSGKTSLIRHTLYEALQDKRSETPEETETEALYRSLTPKAHIDSLAEVLWVQQQSLSRSSRSCIGTYLGILDRIRKIYAEQPLAVKLGLTASSFSFNRAGGRCEQCQGLGTVVEDLSFLGDVTIVCPQCEGRRFSDAVLQVRYKNHSLRDLLALTLDQVGALFHQDKVIRGLCDAVVRIGLGYLTLGQSTSAFSGGEAQRLKLLSLLTQTTGLAPSLLIFDEPTVGLSPYDVNQLLQQLQGLCEVGHTVLVVEHNFTFIRQADWLIELGPGAGPHGGSLLFQGTPQEMAEAEASVTRLFL